MVMKALASGLSGRIVPSKLNFCTLARLAFWIVSTCCATTESTSSSMRLNSSKQAQAPAAARPLNILAMAM